MALFLKRRRYDELDDLSTMREGEKGKAIFDLESRRYEINAEIELLMAKYSKLTKKRAVRKRRHKMGKAPNDYRPR